MVIMALDHSSFFLNKVHPSEFWGVSLPSYPGALEFVTRFITHLCAPGFFLTMGIGMAFWFERYARDLAFAVTIRHFGTRAFLILLLHQFVENPAWVLSILTAESPVETFSPDMMPGGGENPLTALGVLYSLSMSMILWAFCLRLKTSTVLTLSAVAIAVSHYAVPQIDQVQASFSIVQRMLLIAGQTGPVIVTYPILPWLGICGLGIAIGRGLIANRERFMRLIPFLGAAFVATFFLARSFGVGNHHAYTPGEGWIAFLNLTKYPPSINFILLMVGLNLILLYVLQRFIGPARRIAGFLQEFGRMPLFFYLAHLWLFSLLGLFFPAGANYWVTYAGWMVVVGLLYPLCQVYANFRNNKPTGSLWHAI